MVVVKGKCDCCGKTNNECVVVEKRVLWFFECVMLRDLLKARSVKGKEWAAEFVQHIQKSGLTIAEVDEQLMTGWFANAIEVAKTVTSARRQTLVDKANEMLKVQEQSYDYDQYMHGLYNGMEFVLCLIEDRDPSSNRPLQFGVQTNHTHQ